MTEQNDKTPAQEQAPGKTRKKSLYHIAISYLCLVLVTALLLVGGSFSKYTETGTMSGLSLQVAKFDVGVADVSFDREGEFYDDGLILCALEVSNNSNIDITLDMAFTGMTASADFNTTIANVSFYFVEEEDDSTRNEIATLSDKPDDPAYEADSVESYENENKKTCYKVSKTVEDFSYSFALSPDEEKTYLLYASYNITLTGGDNILVTVSGNITFKANQKGGTS